MALTYSSMLELGSKIPHFQLKNALDDNLYASTSLSNGKPSLIMVICNHCPYVIHYHEELVKLSNNYVENINMIAISSNDIVKYPQDSPSKMKELWNSLGLSFPYLFDETQDVAKKYKAECTPEFYLFNQNRKLVYRGRMDETSPGSNTAPSAKDLRVAIKSLLMNQPISDEQFPSMGCNIKWKVS